MVGINQSAKIISIDKDGIMSAKKTDQLTSKKIQKLKQQEW